MNYVQSSYTELNDRYQMHIFDWNSANALGRFEPKVQNAAFFLNARSVASLAFNRPICCLQIEADWYVMKILVPETSNEIADKAIDEGLESHGKEFVAGASDLVPLQVYCENNDGSIVGGLLGNTGNTWLHIWQLWVAENYRNKSLGSQILATAESEAIHRKCMRAHVETLSFQAVKFYLDHGYEEFGVLPNYVGLHSQHYLRKTLVGLKMTSCH